MEDERACPCPPAPGADRPRARGRARREPSRVRPAPVRRSPRPPGPAAAPARGRRRRRRSSGARNRSRSAIRRPLTMASAPETRRWQGRPVRPAAPFGTETAAGSSTSRRASRRNRERGHGWRCNIRKHHHGTGDRASPRQRELFRRAMGRVFGRAVRPTILGRPARRAVRAGGVGPARRSCQASARVAASAAARSRRGRCAAW